MREIDLIFCSSVPLPLIGANYFTEFFQCLRRFFMALRSLLAGPLAGLSPLQRIQRPSSLASCLGPLGCLRTPPRRDRCPRSTPCPVMMIHTALRHREAASGRSIATPFGRTSRTPAYLRSRPAARSFPAASASMPMRRRGPTPVSLHSSSGGKHGLHTCRSRPQRAHFRPGGCPAD